MDVYTNQFHSGHLYLRIAEQEADRLEIAVFERLIDEHRKPLQSIVPADAAKTIHLLVKAGFALKRRCYEMNVQPSDLQAPLSAPSERLATTPKGTSAYAECAERMYVHYAQTHLSVNPLTASLQAFVEMLPDDAYYSTMEGAINAAAFVEGSEIAYLWARDEHAFRAFAPSLLFELFSRHDRITFEADDTDWVATGLKAMFPMALGSCYDTYVKSIDFQNKGKEATK